MASQTQGIQQLLAAEKKAAEKVGEARKRKARRIKQARDEASREINKYRQERERQFKEFEFKYLGSKEEVNAKIDTETEQQMKQMGVDVANNRSKVVDELIELICDVHPVLHRNYNLMNLYKKL